MSFQPTVTPKNRGPLIMIGVAVVVVAIGVIAFVRRDDDAELATTTDSTAAGASTAVSAAGPRLSGGKAVITAPVRVGGAALPPVVEKGADPAVGKPFPTLSGLQVSDGAPLTVAAGGKPTVVIFVAHWCPHCQKEVPRLTAWLKDNGAPDDVVLFAVSTAVAEERGNFPPAQWLLEEGWPIATLADDQLGTAFSAAGLASFPAFVAIDAAGNVVQRSSGELSTAQFEALIDAARRSA